MPREEYIFGFTTEQINALRAALGIAMDNDTTSGQSNAYARLYELLDV